MAESFPVTLAAGPSSKERKYDRQLRLWAASGQQALEDSRVLLINSDGAVDSDNLPLTGVAGVETLKNLVLPGIGGFMVVDPATVSEPDLGVNFFLSEESLGKSRAEETCKYLRELNPDVDGTYSAQPILELLKGETFLPSFRLVIVAGPINQSTLQTISEATKQLNIPLIYVHAVGFYGAFSLQLPSIFPVIDTHPDPESTQDLRLTNPWPELLEAVRKIDNLDSMDDHQHGHVPYLLLLLHFLEKWKAGHDGQYPQNYREKSKFRELVRGMTRTSNPEGGEENFDEAVAAVIKSVNPWSLSSGLRAIFEMEQSSQLTSSSDNFWFIVSAVKSFYEKHGILPLPGSLPDMKAQSADYIQLQNIYKSKARQDVAEVVASVRALENHLRDCGFEGASHISEKEIELFCKNAAHIKVIKGSSLPLLYPSLSNLDSQRTATALKNHLQNPESLLPIFIALKTLDSLVTTYQRSPSSADPPLTASSTTYLQDSKNWNLALPNLLSELKLSSASMGDEELEIQTRIEDAAAEVRRIGAGELHNIAALMGGCVAQESLKVLTKQYVPLDNTFIYDGVKCRGEMFRL
ncbi:hypothetical protein FQN57_002552 [Myotisia sp. PD_48]|nr:hypothetical protein FQN57_002552 [Myotisia sp. PD_48]